MCCLRPQIMMPRAGWIVLLASLGVLGTAFTAQHVFDIAPCVLCLWQRGPYAAAALVSVLALWSHARERRVTWFFVFCCLVFVAGLCLAAFHTGVERHWWAGMDECAAPSLSGDDIAALRENLLRTPIVRCDQISWSFLGLSFANWNVPTSLILTVFTGMVAWHEARRKSD